MNTLELSKAIDSSDAAAPATPCAPPFFAVGTAYFFRTVTYHLVGRIARIEGRFIILADAAWVADSGRWAQALSTGVLNEVEPYPGEVAVNLDTVTDACRWSHALPLVQK